MTERMQTILLFQHVDSYGSRLRLEGMLSVARRLQWNIQSYEQRLDVQRLAEIMDFWRPAGTILSPNNGRDEFDADLFSPERTVLLDCFAEHGLERFAGVITDSFAVTELAARELLSTNCASYAFVPWPSPRAWCENRRQNFTRILKQHGFSLETFRPSRDGLPIETFQRELAPFLRGLAKPCGIFAANDRVGTYVLSTCLQTGLQVPFDCRVVGVDDNHTLCEAQTPSLSSVRLDFRQSGIRAAEMLAQLITDPSASRQLVSLPPLGFIRRSSSRVFRRTDPVALKALDLIQARACAGLSAEAALEVFPCSRRLAEIRFREATGQSVLEAIKTVRLTHAKRLLQNPDLPLEIIAQRCGYQSHTTFCRIFKAATGMTLRQWRQSSKPAITHQGYASL